MLVQWTGHLSFLSGSAWLHQICPTVCLGMATAAKSHKRARKGDVCMVQKQDAFLQKLQVCQELLGRSSSGCRFCGHCCFTLFQGKEDVILKYRREFNQLTRAAQDSELVWIFSTGRSWTDDPAHKPVQQQLAQTTCMAEETSNEEKEEHTSPSEDGHAAQPAKSSTFSPARLQVEATSSSCSGSGARCASGGHVECTSSSSDAPALVNLSSDDDGPPAGKPKTPRAYHRRRRTTAKTPGPTVPAHPFLPGECQSICQRSAIFFVGTSPVKVQRVLHGCLDCRLRGNRVPHGHVTFQSQQMDTTLRFLWRKYHFDAEGLPDRFSVAVRDANSMTIGGCGLPNPTVVPARSALLNQGAAETDGDSIPDVLDPAEMREEEERAIAGMSLIHI